jgi:hypothetical protein
VSSVDLFVTLAGSPIEFGFPSGFITFSAMYYLPQFFSVALSFTPIHAGVFLIPVLAGQMVVSWISVRMNSLSMFGDAPY